MMTDNLASARAKIDALDKKLAALLARRFALAAPLKVLKGRASDRGRERQVIRNARRNAGKPAFGAAAAAVFTEIIRQSKKIQSSK